MRTRGDPQVGGYFGSQVHGNPGVQDGPRGVVHVRSVLLGRRGELLEECDAQKAKDQVAISGGVRGDFILGDGSVEKLQAVGLCFRGVATQPVDRRRRTRGQYRAFGLLTEARQQLCLECIHLRCP